MRSGIVAFLLGVIALLQCASLPPIALTVLLPPCLLLALAQPRARIPLLFACGYLYAMAHGHARLYESLPDELEGKTVTVTGQVASLVEQESRRQKFEFDIRHWSVPSDGTRLPSHIRLSWYTRDINVRAGETWRLRVRLRQPHGFMNPGGFDYERWLFSQGIRATGYVRDSSVNERLEAAPDTLLTWRADLRERIRSHLDEGRGSALVTALAIGDRSGLSTADWQVLRDTGTSHLLAISGLHIGLVATLTFFLWRWAWSCWPAACQWLPAQRAALLLALIPAGGYAALAGFALPTQRALVMLMIVALALSLRRRPASVDILLLAGLGVLILDPLTVLNAGFWLSFLAVAVILWGMGWRLPRSGWWWQYGRIQCLIAIGMLPILLFWFQQYPLFSALANLVAVPWVSMLVVPPILAALPLLHTLPSLGGELLALASWAVMQLWSLLQWLAGIDAGVVARTTPTLIYLLTGLIGAALLLLPRAIPGRWLGLFWLLPLLWPLQQRPEQGEYRLAVLDVGQGLATVVETANHVLVYDTGARFSDSFNAGDAVVLPYLRSRGRHRIDRLIVSHGDNDHIGGAAALNAGLAITSTLSSVPAQLTMPADHCRQGQAWSWDGIHFEILHPVDITAEQNNDLSCVLRIAGRDAVVLIPGDIEAGAERELLKRIPAKLPADVLIAPHHGSSSSSTPRFIRTVQPDYTVFSSGYRNRYQFPDSDIIQRYKDQNIGLFNTAHGGAIRFDIGPAGINIGQTRRLQRRFWHHDNRQLFEND